MMYETLLLVVKSIGLVLAGTIMLAILGGMVIGMIEDVRRKK